MESGVESDFALDQTDLEAVANLYDQLREKWKDIDEGADTELADDFDNHVKETIAALTEALSQNPPQYLEQAHMLKAKHELFKICQVQLTRLATHFDAPLGEMIDTANKQLFHYFNLALGLLAKAAPDIQNLEVALAAAREEINIQREANASLKLAIAQERAELKAELEAAQSESKKYYELLVKRSKQEAQKVLTECDSPGHRPSIVSPKPAAIANPRPLTLKHLKDFIDEIYQSKAKFDKKCEDSKLPRETMEQHMYTYLNQKYGLRSLIVEWAASIITAIQKYSTEDNDVALFAKILRNECDEEFRFIQIQVKETVAELLKVQLKGKFPMKTAADLTKMHKEKMEEFVSEEEWMDIVKYMYNDTDAELLVQLIHEIIQIKNYPVEKPPVRVKMSREEAQSRKEKERMNKGRIMYTDLLKVLLDFQLKGHQKFIGKFVEVFKVVDIDRNGIINEEEFAQVLKEMDINLDETDTVRLLQSVDPHNHQQVTFSDCVALFSSEQVPFDDTHLDDLVSILQKLLLKEEYS